MKNSFASSLENADNLIELCTNEDVDNHYAIVEPIVSKKAPVEKEFKLRMLNSIQVGTAYKTKDNSCFLYYLKNDDSIGVGVCFYGKNNPKGMLILLAGIFNVKDKLLNVLKFTPHNPLDIKYFKSLVVESSIRKYYQEGAPLVLRIDLIREKLTRIGKGNYS